MTRCIIFCYINWWKNTIYT